jgi:hypothetical protein
MRAIDLRADEVAADPTHRQHCASSQSNPPARKSQMTDYLEESGICAESAIVWPCTRQHYKQGIFVIQRLLREGNRSIHFSHGGRRGR